MHEVAGLHVEARSYNQINALNVPAPLSVDVEPKHQVVDYGRPATFRCKYRGNPVERIYWLKDGRDIGHNSSTLRINSVTKEDRGMYQCFVINSQVMFPPDSRHG